MRGKPRSTLIHIIVSEQSEHLTVRERKGGSCSHEKSWPLRYRGSRQLWILTAWEVAKAHRIVFSKPDLH